MKAFVSACVAAIVVAVVAWIVLDSAGMSSADVYTSSSAEAPEEH